MSRLNMENSEGYAPFIKSGLRFGSADWVPVDNEVIDPDAPTMLILRPAGAIDILMPESTEARKGLAFLLVNASANAITLKTSLDAAFTTAIALAANEVTWVVCTGAATWCLAGEQSALRHQPEPGEADMKFAGFFTGMLSPGVVRPSKAMIGGFVSAPVVDTTAGALTITTDMLKAGVLVRDPNGAGRTDVLPSAAQIVAAFPGLKAGDVISLLVVNNADAAEAITVSAGANGTVVQIAGTRTIPQNTTRMVYLRMTAVGNAPTYSVYM